MPDNREQIVRETRLRIALMARGLYRWYQKRRLPLKTEISSALAHNSAVDQLLSIGWYSQNYQRPPLRYVESSDERVANAIEQAHKVRISFRIIAKMVNDPAVTRCARLIGRPLRSMEGTLRLIESSK
jgi:hypothetical protein